MEHYSLLLQTSQVRPDSPRSKTTENREHRSAFIVRNDRPHFCFFQTQTLVALMLSSTRGNHFLNTKSIRPDPADRSCGQRLGARICR